MLPPEAIREFQEIMRQDYGVQMSLTSATEQANRYIDFMQAVSHQVQPIDDQQIQSRQWN